MQCLVIEYAVVQMNTLVIDAKILQHIELLQSSLAFSEA
jgi:hypothetical protein